MNMKQAVINFFEKRRKIKGSEEWFFTTYEIEGVEDNFLLSIEGGKGRWEPKEVTTIYNFSSLEKSLGMEIHSSIKEYFNVFWFAALVGRPKI